MLYCHNNWVLDSKRKSAKPSRNN